MEIRRKINNELTAEQRSQFRREVNDGFPLLPEQLRKMLRAIIFVNDCNSFSRLVYKKYEEDFNPHHFCFSYFWILSICMGRSPWSNNKLQPDYYWNLSSCENVHDQWSWSCPFFRRIPLRLSPKLIHQLFSTKELFTLVNALEQQIVLQEKVLDRLESSMCKCTACT